VFTSRILVAVFNTLYIAKGILVETEQLLVDPKGTPYVRMIVGPTLHSIPHPLASFM
jgi:hypothetical protein